MPSFSLTRMISAAGVDTFGKKVVDEEEEGMIWGSGIGVFKLAYSSRLPTESIIPSPDKSGVFTSFSDTKTFVASYIPYPSSKKFPPASCPSSPPSDTFSLASSPPYLPSDTFPPAYTPSSSPSEVSIMVFNKLPAFRCTRFTCLCLCDIWDRTGTSLPSFFFLFFGGDVFGESRLAQLPRWGGQVSLAWHRDDDLARPRMGKITIYHVQ